MKEINFDTLKKYLPQKLAGQSRWTVWTRSPSGKPSLYQPSEHQVIPAYPTDPYTWDSADEALRALLYNPTFSEAFLRGEAGLAYINSKTLPVATINLYGAVLGDRRVAPWALAYLDVLDAYAEEGFTPGSLLFLWEGPLEPFSKANVAVNQPPFIPLTLRKVPGSPPRVGTAKTRYERFLKMVEEVSGRYAEKISTRFAPYGPEVAAVMGKLVDYGLRARKENRWISRCPACGSLRPTLSVALEDRLYLSCSQGCLPQDVVAALGVPWSEERFSPKPLKEEVQPIPLEDPKVSERVEAAYLALFNAPGNHPLLQEYGISQEAALDMGLGLEEVEGEEGGRLLVPTYLRFGVPGKDLLGFRLLGREGRLLEAFPTDEIPWVSPGYEGAEAFLVVEEPLRAMALWALLSKDPQKRWATMYVPSGFPLSTTFFRRGKVREVYLWPDQVRTLQGWQEALRNMPYRLYLVPIESFNFSQPRAQLVSALRSLLGRSEPII